MEKNRAQNSRAAIAYIIISNVRTISGINRLIKW